MPLNFGFQNPDRLYVYGNIHQGIEVGRGRTRLVPKRPILTTIRRHPPLRELQQNMRSSLCCAVAPRKSGSLHVDHIFSPNLPFMLSPVSLGRHGMPPLPSVARYGAAPCPVRGAALEDRPMRQPESSSGDFPPA